MSPGEFDIVLTSRTALDSRLRNCTMPVNRYPFRRVASSRRWRPAWLVWLALCSLAYAEPTPGVAGEARVVTGVFTSRIVDRRPVDQVLILTNDVDTVYFYTDLRMFQGQTVTHRWEYEGQLVSEKKFEVGGPSWRVYSVKKLKPTMTGEWSVVVSDSRGWPVYAAIFRYVDKAPGTGSVILPPPRE